MAGWIVAAGAVIVLALVTRRRSSSAPIVPLPVPIPSSGHGAGIRPTPSCAALGSHVALMPPYRDPITGDTTFVGEERHGNVTICLPHGDTWATCIGDDTNHRIYCGNHWRPNPPRTLSEMNIRRAKRATGCTQTSCSGARLPDAYFYGTAWSIQRRRQAKYGHR